MFPRTLHIWMQHSHSFTCMVYSYSVARIRLLSQSLRLVDNWAVQHVDPAWPDQPHSGYVPHRTHTYRSTVWQKSPWGPNAAAFRFKQNFCIHTFNIYEHFLFSWHMVLRWGSSFPYAAVPRGTCSLTDYLVGLLQMKEYHSITHKPSINVHALPEESISV